MSETNPHRAGTKAAAAWAARQAKKKTREQKTEALQAAPHAAKECVTAPRELGDLGILRTRAWCTLHSRLARAVAAKRPKLEPLQADVAAMRSVLDGSASADRCAELAGAK